MNTRQLECFIRLSNNLNFAKTADEMFLAQSTVSREIKALEDELGFVLFKRTSKSVELTEQGESFKNSIIPLYNSLVSIVSRVKNGSDQQTIKMGFFHVASMRKIPNAISKFHEKYPNILPEIHQANLENLVSMYRSRELDLIFAVKSIMEPTEEDTVVDMYKGVFCATIPHSNPLSKCEKITPDMFNGYDILTLHGNASHSSFSNFDHELSIKCPDSRMIQCASVDEQEVYLRSGIGIAMSTDYSFENLDYYTQIPIDSEFINDLPLEYAIMYHNDLKDKYIDEFVKYLHEAFEK